MMAVVIVMVAAIVMAVVVVMGTLLGCCCGDGVAVEVVIAFAVREVAVEVLETIFVVVVVVIKNLFLNDATSPVFALLLRGHS